MKTLKSFFGFALLCLLLFATENVTAAVSTPSNTKTDFRTAFANVKKEFSELKKEAVKGYQKVVKKIKTELKTTEVFGKLLILTIVSLVIFGLGSWFDIYFLTLLGSILLLIAAVWFILHLVELI